MLFLTMATVNLYMLKLLNVVMMVEVDFPGVST